ncbi:hypothetical protein K493DRAFT_100061 [Basidiobolus meristosporus CBS 931.73]|uniref:Myb-like domain-containing protein n=1 Tax=Basidiobolus meristosporus CBS 931.73 TaxID=1314790 RepID=A0A1Y1YRV8_9FUNG|nr:hypothetical protein K493DRAFT_100061 [Basidiobolus meristosporus CBS 931.73]|eukprot:ORY00762.1 hypothetical protein K493DRAFT_100061 [Basidiobolus meristosporus CBS 931.73]
MLLSTGEKPGRGIWKPPETKRLIEVRRELDDLFFYTKKRIVDEQWQKVAERLQASGFNRTMLECKIKWKNLLQKFKETLQPGYNGPSFPFSEDMQWYAARLSREGKEESSETPTREGKRQSPPAGESSHTSHDARASLPLIESRNVSSPRAAHKLSTPLTPQGISEPPHGDANLKSIHSAYMPTNASYQDTAGSMDPLPVEPSAIHYSNQPSGSRSPPFHGHQYPTVSSPIPMSKRLKPTRFEEILFKVHT